MNASTVWHSFLYYYYSLLKIYMHCVNSSYLPSLLCRHWMTSFSSTYSGIGYTLYHIQHFLHHFSTVWYKCHPSRRIDFQRVFSYPPSAYRPVFQLGSRKCAVARATCILKNDLSNPGWIARDYLTFLSCSIDVASKRLNHLSWSEKGRPWRLCRNECDLRLSRSKRSINWLDQVSSYRPAYLRRWL